MKVSTLPDGHYQVTDADGRAIAGPFATHADAWRWLDRQTGEPISKREDIADWSWQRWTGE